MFHRLNQRAVPYLLLVAVAVALFLPNLGGPSLWDIDEGHNAEAAREMLASGNYVVPTFNFRLRVDKPALLYWLQLGAYQLCGVNEFAARLPSALAALLAVLLTYELGRRLFDPWTGLLAGLVVSSTLMFCAAAHFANPDALLCACTVLTLLVFWQGFATTGRVWFVPVGVAAGLGMLAKGPVGLVLPAAVIGLFLLWCRRLHLLWTWRLGYGALAFAGTALPWYIWVGVDTKTDFLRGFFLTHNVDRYLRPMESHGGPFYYYLVVLALGFAPWSSFLALTAWNAVRESRARDAAAPAVALRFLACWVLTYLVFFSLSGTKLPNYILPIYPAVALLTARFLVRWLTRALHPPGWVVNVSLGCVALLGLGTVAGLLVASGAVPVPALRGRVFPGLERWAVLGVLPLAGAAVAWWCARRDRRLGLVLSLAGTAFVFCGTLASWGSAALEAYKAPRALAETFRAGQAGQEVRVGCYQYYQPSLVFYCRREVCRLKNEDETLEFLTFPIPVYLFVPTSVWEGLKTRAAGTCRVLGRNRDLYRGFEVVVVTNR